MRALIQIGIVLSLVGTENAQAKSVCVPGVQIACPCRGGAASVQVCNKSGKGYLPCDCATPGVSSPPRREEATAPTYEETAAWLAKTVVAEAKVITNPNDEFRTLVNIPEFSVRACALTWVEVRAMDTTVWRDTLSFNMQPDVKIRLSTYDGAPISRLSLSTKAESFRSSTTKNGKFDRVKIFDTAEIQFPPNSSCERVYKAFLRLQSLCGADGATAFAGKGTVVSNRDLEESSREQDRAKAAEDERKDREDKQRSRDDEADRQRAREQQRAESAAAIQGTIDSVNGTSATFARARAELAASAQHGHEERRAADAQRREEQSSATEARRREAAQTSNDATARRRADQEAVRAAAEEKRNRLAACLAQQPPQMRTAKTNPFIADRQGFESLLASAHRCMAQPWEACMFSPHMGALWAVEGQAETDHTELFRRFNAPAIHIGGGADVCLDQPVKGTRGECRTDVSNNRGACIARLKQDIAQLDCDGVMLPKVWAAENSLRDAEAKTKQDEDCRRR